MSVRSMIPKQRFSTTTRIRQNQQQQVTGEITGLERQRLNAQEARKAMELSRQKMYNERAKKHKSVVMYTIGTIVISLGITYAAVPLYRAFCSATGFAGTPMTDPTRFSPDRLYVTPETQGRKRITVRFEATSADTLPWKFEPVTRSVRVLPGETALAFYTAKNTGDKDLIGIATYNMTPEKIAPYFAKVECFCFEEQKIRAGEEVDLPVFFFIDRDIMDDPALDGIDDVVLSYTFFKARRNDRGHLVPDASDEEVQKSQGWENYEVAKANHKLHAPPTQPA
ncbi:cytochrome c oxidase assembly protein subunit 11 [Kwoniella heveanensis CBS 569]|nr:cytochrome c oxidase assembly protein subunit 11 [Kwoniella heveanensis CBS 569]